VREKGEREGWVRKKMRKDEKGEGEGVKKENRGRKKRVKKYHMILN
jgi:hypothetical protein